MEQQVQHAIGKQFEKELDQPVKVENIKGVSGGSINQAFLLKTSKGPYFVKLNSKSRYPNMFETEARGLSLLKNCRELVVPQPYFTGSTNDTAYIVMEYIEEGMAGADFWKNFANGLASLHKIKAEYFGLDHHNYIGSLPQYNTHRGSWIEFFVEMRLEIQLKMALDDGKIGSDISRKFETLFHKLGNYFPEEAPSLVHGDLWSGNYLKAQNDRACIIDPAVYYGFREMDIAMSKLFGGFDKAFYGHYQEVYPMEDGWQERLDLCNLYPLMVHVNLFGGSYLGSVQAILRNFT